MENQFEKRSIPVEWSFPTDVVRGKLKSDFQMLTEATTYTFQVRSNFRNNKIAVVTVKVS